MDFGGDYAGTLSQTWNGFTCRMWADRTPLGTPDLSFQTSGFSHFPENYCRNPDGDSGGAWCYTNNAKFWEYCSIPDCRDVNECELGTHSCDENATCTDTLGSYTCECNSPFTGDGFDCTMCPSNDECWNYNATTHTCSMEPGCSALTCGSLAIDIAMEPELFGLTDPDSAIWVSDAQPTWDGNKLRYSTDLGHSDQRVFMTKNEEYIVAEVSFAIGGENRQRSAGRVKKFYG